MLRTLIRVGQICMAQVKTNNGKPSVLIAMDLHKNARCEIYPRTKDMNIPVRRFPVPNEKVSWQINFPNYDPTEYTSDGIKKRPDWADPDCNSSPEEYKRLEFNNLDGKVDRRSHETKYSIKDGYPLNPRGRTGVKGRGCLGRWGPNHAADPIVTRWKTDENGDIKKGTDGKHILEFVCVKRRDNGEWAIPGGMVNAGEVVTETLRREFEEEALNTVEMSAEETKAIRASIDQCFKNGQEVYKGYVDDPRNTDNAWMETVAYNFHDETGISVGKLKLHAGDDAVGVQWMTISRDLKLYTSHYDFIKKVVDKHDASWLHIAALHYNENSNNAHAVTKTGQERWRIAYPKSKKGTEAVVKPCKVDPTFGYIALLRQALLDLRQELPTCTEAHMFIKGASQYPPPLTEAYKQFSKDELIRKHKSRFLNS